MVDKRALRCSPRDNVAVLLDDVVQGEEVGIVEDLQATAKDALVVVSPRIGLGHKIAIDDLEAGTVIVKYAFPIGHLTEGVTAGGWVHVQNLQSGVNVASAPEKVTAAEDDPCR